MLKGVAKNNSRNSRISTLICFIFIVGIIIFLSILKPALSGNAIALEKTSFMPNEKIKLRF